MTHETSEAAAHHQVRVHIDEHEYESPTPTTGEALYALGHVHEGMTLYREVTGDREDEPVEKGPQQIHLQQDEHFHSGHHHGITIIVNAQQKTVSTRTLSFDELVALAFDPIPVGPNILFTITYRKGPHANQQGELAQGATVKIKEGMIFNVTYTDRS